VTAATKLDVEDVRDALDVEDIVSHFALKVRNRGSQLRMTLCPRCGDTSSSEAIAIDKRSGRWIHHGRERDAGGECSGDALDLVGACAGLKDFPSVLALAAKIAGVEARALTDAERAERRVFRQQRQAERQRQAEAEQIVIVREAKVKAASTLQRLARTRETRTCAAYLRSRGLDGTRLLQDDHVRSDLIGNPHVTLWSLDDSEPINVVCRMITPVDGKPTHPGLYGCPTSGTLCGRILDIVKGSTVVITEGVIDTLTAIHLWPERVVLGAHGAGRMACIAETVAPIVLANGGKLVLVPDSDDIGQRNAIKAGEAAMAAGLEMDNTLIVVELGAHHDLNAAHCAGWKP